MLQDVLAAKAECLLAQHDIASAYQITKRVCGVDPYNRRAACTHITVLMALGRSADLFQLAHHAVDSASKGGYGTFLILFVLIPMVSLADPLSWMAVGAYYLTQGNTKAALKNFKKAVTMGPAFAPAWTGLGHAAACEMEIGTQCSKDIV